MHSWDVHVSEDVLFQQGGGGGCTYSLCSCFATNMEFIQFYSHQKCPLFYISGTILFLRGFFWPTPIKISIQFVQQDIARNNIKVGELEKGSIGKGLENLFQKAWKKSDKIKNNRKSLWLWRLNAEIKLNVCRFRRRWCPENIGLPHYLSSYLLTYVWLYINQCMNKFWTY